MITEMIDFAKEHPFWAYVILSYPFALIVLWDFFKKVWHEYRTNKESFVTSFAISISQFTSGKNKYSDAHDFMENKLRSPQLITLLALLFIVAVPIIVPFLIPNFLVLNFYRFRIFLNNIRIFFIKARIFIIYFFTKK